MPDRVQVHMREVRNLVCSHDGVDNCRPVNGECLVDRGLELARFPGTPVSIGSGMTPPAPEIGCPPPSNMRERLTANRAPFGQKPGPARSDTFKDGVAAWAPPVRPLALAAAASATVAPTV